MIRDSLSQTLLDILFGNGTVLELGNHLPTDGRFPSFGSVNMRVSSGSVPCKVVLRDEVEGGRAWLADLDAAQINLSQEEPPTARLDLLAQAVTAGWLEHCPIPQTRREMVRFCGMVAAQLVRDIEQQGGQLALLKLESVNSAEPHVRALSRGTLGTNAASGRPCPICATSIAPGSVVASDPFRDDEGPLVVRVACCCESCGWVEWREYANPAGRPSGIAPDGAEARVVDEDEARALCDQHPEAAGMVMV